MASHNTLVTLNRLGSGSAITICFKLFSALSLANTMLEAASRYNLVFVLLSSCGDMLAVLKLSPTKRFNFSAIPVYTIPIGVWHIICSFALEDYNSTYNKCIPTCFTDEFIIIELVDSISRDGLDIHIYVIHYK